MCGIIGAVAQRDVVPILLEGLKRLEYRGYDSAGVAVVDSDQRLQRIRVQGKVVALEEALSVMPLVGNSGIAHTRWATHGVPSERNAHPHQSGETIAVVHNGIIENHEALRRELAQAGYAFESDTDTELVAHLLHRQLRNGQDWVNAVQASVARLHGAFALAILFTQEPERLLVVRRGSPLVIGVGIGEHFIASDTLALLPVTQRFIHLEEGDIADIRRETLTIYSASGEVVQRACRTSDADHQVAERGEYRHYMQKEIFSQPQAVADTLEGRLSGQDLLPQAFGEQAPDILARTQQVQIVACGTSYHAGLVARYWLEEVGIPCQVEVASEFRYRPHPVGPNTLLVVLSQSGETADTLAALRRAQEMEYLASLAICNVAESTLVRESQLQFLTRAGREMGVASTKAFTTQLTALLLLTGLLDRRGVDRSVLATSLRTLPERLQAVLSLDDTIRHLAESLAPRAHALFLGRGAHYPIALEGALKLKEISYIHAEAYPAGELKHGPLALVDQDMPVVAVAPNDVLLEKLKSNLAEVRARGGQLIIFTSHDSGLNNTAGVRTVNLPAAALLEASDYLLPLLYTLPLQMLAYHVAVLKGTDVDQPRNLAKSVTVE